ncbi:MAG: TRAP transporter permease [Deferrisomatales bacterium]
MPEPTADVEAAEQNLAQRLKEEEELGLRRPQGSQRWLVPAIALAWSLFQLSIASWLLLDSTYIRAIHLAFAFAIVFLSYPTLRRTVRVPGLRWLGEKRKIPWVDMVLALLAVATAVYIAWDYEGVSARLGIPNARDIAFGLLLVLFLLEASRRVLGPAMPIIAGTFTLYAFFGPYMPDVIAFKGVSLDRYVSQISMSTEGIYGIPLDVSATVVFLFVLFGAMLEKAGGGRFFIDLAMSLLGRFKGGPAKAAVMSSGLTGLVSGSSIANVVTTGTFTIPLMKKVGYPPTKAAAIEVAASTDGQIMPPIMGAAAFIIAEYVNVPYLEVCKAAAIPAFASYATLFYLTHIEASKLGLEGLPKEELPGFFQTLFSGLHYLLPLFVLLYELIVPRHSPDLAAFRAILVLAAVMLLQHPVRAWREGGEVGQAFRRSAAEILAGLVAGARNMVSVAIATAAAGIIVGVVTMGLGGLITDVIDTLSRGNIYLMLAITAFASLIMGMGLPTTATYIVMAALTAPAIVQIAEWNGFFVPIIAAHLFCFYFGILADDTPPVGLAAYAAAAIAKSPPIPTGLQGFMYDIRTAILPFMFILNHDLILWEITSWPLGLTILAAACVGAFAFASATQGWFLTWNRWYEIPLLLSVTLIMMRPDWTAHLLGVAPEQRYWMYAAGLAVLGLVYLLQKPRAAKTVPSAA